MNKQKLQELKDHMLKGIFKPADITLKVIEALLEEPKAESVRPTKWRAEKYKPYWFINDCGSIWFNREEYVGTDNYRYLTDNYFKTEQEAEKALEVIKAKGRLSHAYYGLVGDWKPDWSNHTQDKYSFYFDSGNKSLEFISHRFNTYQFPSLESRSQFIKENEADLKLVLNINDNE